MWWRRVPAPADATEESPHPWAHSLIRTGIVLVLQALIFVSIDIKCMLDSLSCCLQCDVYRAESVLLLNKTFTLNSSYSLPTRFSNTSLLHS